MYKPCLHFVGFRSQGAVDWAARIWGKPDFVHVHLDARALADMAPEDTVLYATKASERFVPYAYDDSN
jgi:hypothetical protein